MKRLSVLFTALAIIIASASCKADGGVQPSMDNAVIIFFSATGNTERVAQELAAITEAHIAEIEPAEPYSDTDLDYRDDSSRASLENSNPAARPAILPLSEDISGYDTIFLGFPIWFGDMPKIIYTFLDEYDLSGKTIAPFCTSGSSGISRAEENIRAMESNATVFAGARISNRESLESWLGDIGL